MKKYYLIALILMLGTACSLSKDLFGKDFSGKADYEENVDGTYPIAAGMPIRVIHSMGDLTVTVWDRKEVALKARIEVEGDDAEKFGSQISIEVTGEGKLFVIETTFPDGEWEDLSYGVRIDLVLPSDHHLEVNNSFGDLSATGLKAGITAEASFGALAIEGIEGAIDLTASFGPVKVENSSGKTVIAGNGGSVTVDNLFAGDLDISNNIGDIDIKDVAGNVTMHCGNGKVSAKNVAGNVRSGGSFGRQEFKSIAGGLHVKGQNSNVDAEKIGDGAVIEASFGSVKLDDVGGDATLILCNGRASAEGIKGNVDVKNEFGNTDVKKVTGNCRVRTCNGGVDVEEIKGSVDVENTFGPVKIKHVGGSIIAECTNGNIKASGLAYGSGEKQKANTFTLKTTFGLIEIALPTPPSCTLEANAAFGTIKSDFSLGGVEKGMTSQKCKCTLGEGLAEIKLTSSNGGIKIKKD